MKDLLALLRLLAVIEGISLLVLLFIAMPLKYYYGNPEVVSVVGMTHGILFMLFVAYSSFVGQRMTWSDKFLFLVVLSSMIPFGMFVMDRKLKAIAS